MPWIPTKAAVQALVVKPELLEVEAKPELALALVVTLVLGVTLVLVVKQALVVPVAPVCLPTDLKFSDEMVWAMRFAQTMNAHFDEYWAGDNAPVIANVYALMRFV